MEIVNYKAWTYKSYQKAYNVRYVNIINKLEKGTAILRTSIGFAPLLIRFLRIKGFDASGEEFRSREVTFPGMQLSLYDFQERMVADWLRAGAIGVIKAPTGSGKTIIGSKAIEEIGRKTLILVHTSDLLVNVWIDSLTKSFGPGITYQVGIVGGGVTDKDRVTMRIGTRTNSFDANMRKDIVIATFQTLINHLDELRNYKFGLMVVDECIPIDSKIWTQDGVIRYEDLGYGQEYKNDVFQVWSNDKDDNIVNNGYKKVKTRMKHMYRTTVETGDELVCSLDHKVLTRKDDGKEEFVEIEKAKNIGLSLIKPYDMKKECILARIFGYMLGDGWIDINRAGGAGGDYNGLSRMAYDIKKLHYLTGIGKSSIGGERELHSTIDSIAYGKLDVQGSVHTIKLDKNLSEKLIELGMPIGRKTNCTYAIPEWIMKGNREIKEEFLAGYLGAEGTNPSFRGNKDNKLKKSFYVPRFSITKRIDLINEGLKLVDQFKELFNEFDIKISDVDTVDGNIRKDGTITRKIIVTIGNEFENLRRYLRIGYRYCYEKEKEEEVIRLYLNYIKECNKERQELNNMVTNLCNNKRINRRDIPGIINNIRLSTQKNILDSWEGCEDEKIIKKKYLIHLTEGMASDILHPHKKNGVDIIARSPAGVIPFNKWNKRVSGDIIFLDILKHEYREYEQGYTLTVNNDHNYLVNGFIVKNCHHAPAQMFRKVNAVIKAPYKLGLSATVRRLDGMEKDIFGALGDIQSQVSIRELINKGILAEPRFQSPVIIDQEVMAAIETCGLGGLNLSRFVKKASAASQKKLDYIINICKNIAARGRTFLLFTDYVRAEDVFVRDMYAERLIQEGLSISIVDQGMSSDERSKVFNYLETGKISGIIFGKLGSEGVNIPSVNVVVMANGIKSPITFCQRVGRVMRKVPGKDFCDVYEVLIDIPMEHKWSDFNFAEYRAEGFQKTVYKVE